MYQFDLIHTKSLDLVHLPELYKLSKRMADVVVPNEYGVTPPRKA